MTATYTRTAGETVAGSPYTISATLAPAGVLDNYDITYNTAGFTIDKKQLSVNAVADSKTYGASDPTFAWTYSGFAGTEDAVSAGITGNASCARTAGEAVAGSPYTITCAPGTLDAANYSFATGATANFTINKKDASVTPNDDSKTYGAADPAFTGTLTGFLAADGVSATYSRTAGETVAGSPYTISATLAPAGVLGNYDITYNTASFMITARPVTVRAKDATKVYGSPDPTFLIELFGGTTLGGSDTLGALGTPSFTFTPASPVNVGSYRINVGGLSNSNYDISYAQDEDRGVFTITKKDASVTPAAKTKVYGQADPALTGTLSGFLAADGVIATYSRTAGETVAGSPYTISATLSPAGVLGNYDIAYDTANFTITRKAASVTPDAKSKILGAADPVLTGTLSGFLAPDGVTATYTRTPGETIAGNPYTISATLAPVAVLDNYTITYNTANFTILFGWNGFLQPINDTAHQTGLNESKFKLGQTIPAKFVLKNASGQVVQQTGSPTFSRSDRLGSCDSTAVLDTIEEVALPDGVPVYKWDGAQYHYNWSTKGLTAGEYRIFANLADGTKRYVDICLTK